MDPPFAQALGRVLVGCDTARSVRAGEQPLPAAQEDAQERDHHRRKKPGYGQEQDEQEGEHCRRDAAKGHQEVVSRLKLRPYGRANDLRTPSQPSFEPLEHDPTVAHPTFRPTPDREPPFLSIATMKLFIGIGGSMPDV